LKSEEFKRALEAIDDGIGGTETVCRDEGPEIE
jgi:hypothetical protein